MCVGRQVTPLSRASAPLHNRAQAVPQLDALGLDLLGSMLRYDPSQRIRCRAALAHAWFDDVRDAEEARGRAAGEAAQRARREAQARLAAAAAASAAQADGAASAGVGGTSHLLDLAPSNSGEWEVGEVHARPETCHPVLSS